MHPDSAINSALWNALEQIIWEMSLRNRADYIIPTTLLALILLAAAMIAVNAIAPSSITRIDADAPDQGQAMVLVYTYELRDTRYFVLKTDQGEQENLSPQN